MKGFPLKMDYSADWWNVRGWRYDLDSDEFIENFPKDRVITKAVLVEGGCADNYNDNIRLAEYDLYYNLAKLGAYRSTKLKNTTFNKALEEANRRITSGNLRSE